MTVEILYVADCPSHSAAVKLVKDALAAEGAPSDVSEVLVRNQRMAARLRFAGSPTIRINGRDILTDTSKEPESFGLNCRFCPGSQQPGLPTQAMVQLAVREAAQANNS